MIKAEEVKEKLTSAIIMSVVWALYVYKVITININLLNIIPVIVSISAVSYILAFLWNDYFKGKSE